MDDLTKLIRMREWYIQKCAEERRHAALLWVFDLAFEAIELRKLKVSKVIPETGEKECG